MKEKGAAYLEPLGGSKNYEIWNGGKKQSKEGSYKLS